MKFLLLSLIFMIPARGAGAMTVNCIEGKKLSDNCKGLHDAGFVGCCDHRINVWCEINSQRHTEALCYHDCALNDHPLLAQCGWNPHFGFYSCFDGGQDPASENPNPIACPACTPECEGKECGYNGCYGLCGRCDQGKYCNKGKCLKCGCDGRECGPDQCGRPCGTCANGKYCDKSGKCVDIGAVPSACFANPEPESEDSNIGKCVCDEVGDWPCCKSKWSLQCVDQAMELCGLSCACKPDCMGKECGDDGCGGDCGNCDTGTFCYDGQCDACRDCSKLECGSNGCGRACGTCADNKACIRGKCKEPPAWCEEKTGPGCDNQDQACNATVVECVCEGKNDHYCCDTKWDWLCVTEYLECSNVVFEKPLTCPCVPNCDARECGDDGCEGTCGQCKDGLVCNRFGRCVKSDVRCGNDKCEQGEDCRSCPEDCGSCCGNGTCDHGENCGTCPKDCGCGDGLICDNGVCVTSPPEPVPDITEDAFEASADTLVKRDPGVVDEDIVANEDVIFADDQVKRTDLTHIRTDIRSDTGAPSSGGCDTGKNGNGAGILLFLTGFFALWYRGNRIRN